MKGLLILLFRLLWRDGEKVFERSALLMKT